MPTAELESMALVLQAPDQGVEKAQILRHISSGRASVSLTSMFSSQQGSWPFEPFVHNGLFRVIASYQTHHPQVVLLRGGSIDLAQLYKALGNEQVMSRHKDGYLLSYPLQIAPDAALNIDNSTLYLRQQSGTALINQGELNLQQATLTSWSGSEGAEPAPGFRPFVIAWAGSRTRIVDSRLNRLGYNAHLAHGLTLARGAQQAPGLAPASLLLRGSRIGELSSGVELHNAMARIEDNRFENLQQYAVDLEDTRVSLIGNHVRKVKNQSAIRLRGSSQGVLERNVILDAGKAGIEVREQQGDLVVRQNIIGTSQSSGILLRQITALPGARLLLLDNHIANTQGSGIDGEAVELAHLMGNRIGATPEYAIRFRNPADRPSRLIMMGNQMAQTGKAMIRTEGIERVVLGNNRYQMAQVNQPLLAGDLMPVQSLLMEATLQRPCVVEVLIGIQADTNPADGLPANCRDGS
ncbi:MAG: right-handed parallel beta-helix repeat-containing protein [Pseudomonadota bacterium]